MTRDPDVQEAYSYLIALHSCTDVVLEDLFLHHGQTDALLLSDDVSLTESARGIACRGIQLNRVRCHNNARGGLAPLQVYGLQCVDCSFVGNGYDLGRYLAHAPGFGVDVEPDRFRPSEVDVRTGNLEFLRCQFRDNIGNFLAAFTERYQGFLRLIDCDSSNRRNASNHMLISWPGAVVQGGVHDIGTGWFWTSWQGERGGDLMIRNCELRGAGNYNVHHVADGNIVHLDGVRMIGTHRTNEPGPFIALYGNPGRGRLNTMRRCEIFIPAARKYDDHAYDPRVRLANTLCESNLFRTDLPAVAGRHFAIEYGSGCVVRGDRYRGTSPGPNDSFRPGINSQFDTRRPFSV